jgi:hypothetical protein
VLWRKGLLFTQAALRQHLLESLTGAERYTDDFDRQGSYREWIRSAPARFDQGVQELTTPVAELCT